jgi:replicative DNA helicase
MNTRTENLLDANLAEQTELRRRCETELMSISVLYPEYIPLVATIVSPNDFCNQELQELFRLVESMSLNGEPISATSVMIAAQRSGLVARIGGAAEYTRLINDNQIQNPKLAEFVARELARLSACSTVYAAAIELTKRISEKSAKPDEELTVFRTKTDRASVQLSKPAIPIGSIIKSILHQPDGAIDGTRISTGFEKLDELVGGMFTKNLTLLGGRFGKGKSCLAAQLVSNAVFASKSAVVFSLEMSEREFTQRIISSECGVSMNAWLRRRNDEEQQRIWELHKKQQGCKWWIDDRSHQTVNTIRTRCQLAKYRDGIDLIVIDNLQLLSPIDRHLPKDQQKKAETEELKRIARDLDVSILLLCQLDSEAGRSRPNETSWATCKSIAGDADLAMMLHQPEATQDNPKPDYELIVTKVRSTGERGTLHYRFDGEFQRFEELLLSTSSHYQNAFANDFQRI